MSAAWPPPPRCRNARWPAAKAAAALASEAGARLHSRCPSSYAASRASSSFRMAAREAGGGALQAAQQLQHGGQGDKQWQAGGLQYSIV